MDWYVSISEDAANNKNNNYLQIILDVAVIIIVA
jgi:hypothetical protein